MSPFEALFGIKMRHVEDIQVLSLIEQEHVQFFNEERDGLRKLAKQGILKIQAENQRYYNKRRKKARLYKIGDLKKSVVHNSLRV